MIDYETLHAQWAEQNDRLRQANAADRKTIFDAFADLGIERVEIDFDGYGDSGQIENIAVTGGSDRLTGEVTITRVPWIWPNETHTCPLAEAVESLCYSLLEQEHGGWQDNDGSFGTFTFDVAARTVELRFNGRYTDYESYTHTFEEA